MPSAVESPRRPIPDEEVPTKPVDLSQKLAKLSSPRRTGRQQRSSSPAPETPGLPPPPAHIHFHHPVRRILSPHDHKLFLASSTYTLVTSFIFGITDSVRGLAISAATSRHQQQHPTIDALLDILTNISTLRRAYPPDHTNGSRFGNATFRTFLSALSPKVEDWHKALFPTLSTAAQDELNTYLHASLGSALRIDYGSGHELNFLIYLLCLNRLGLLLEDTFPAIALVVFPQYLDLMRTIQGEYYLEPAGSHGVWGLDDYHFLPFLFGAAQLADPEPDQSSSTDQPDPMSRRGGAAQGITPLSIHSSVVLSTYSHDYLYLSQIAHVNATKTVQGLRWHSPMLDDISGVKVRDGGWNKIEQGMRKMFVREVLGKLVVMQHFLFGGCVPAVEGMSGGDEDDQVIHVSTEDGDAVEVEKAELKRAEGHSGHAHNADSWGDCCGIRVPSSVGAIGEMKRRTGGQGLRRLPFD